MILKGNARKNGKELATHLLRTDTNERVDVSEVRGFLAEDLHGAFSEIEAIATGTKAERYLYSLSINPDEPLSREQYGEAISHIEDKLGLADQARAVVFHEKDGREHCHVVWSKINTAEMKAVHMAFDRQVLRECARDLSRQFGHELPEGLKADRGAERFKTANDRNPIEIGQEERTGLSADERRARLTEAYRQSDSLAAFDHALENQGFYLCRGDRRGFVVVDMAGEVHSLTRQIEGATAKAIKAKLNLGDPDALMSVQEAKRMVMDRSRAQAEHRTAESHPTPAELVQAVKSQIKATEGDYRATLAELRDQQAERLTSAQAAIKEAYREEWGALFKRQRAELKELEALKNPLNRLKAFLMDRNRDRLAGEGHGGFLRNAYNATVKGNPKIEDLERAHKAERRQLGDMKKLATREEVKAIKGEITTARKSASRSHREKIEPLKKNLARISQADPRTQSPDQRKAQMKPKSARKSFADQVKAKKGAEAVKKAEQAAKRKQQREQGRDLGGRTR